MISHTRTHKQHQTFIYSVDIFYTLNTECLVLVDFGVETPITASFPSRNGANKCVFPGVTTIVWIGIWRGMSKTGFRLFVEIQSAQPKQNCTKFNGKKKKKRREEKNEKKNENKTHKLNISIQRI